MSIDLIFYQKWYLAMSIDLIFDKKGSLAMSIKKIPGGPLVSLEPTKYNRKEGYNVFIS